MANQSFGSIPANQDANQIPGTTITDNAAAGNIGEANQNNLVSGSGIGLTSATPANVVSMALTAGDWDVSGLVNFSFTSATQSGDSQAGASAASAILPTNDYNIGFSGLRNTTTTCNQSCPVPTQRMSLAGAITTIYLVAQASFSAGSCKASGLLYARRAR